MIIGHLPVGYLAACASEPAFGRDRVIWWSLLAGSVVPDLDMLWFFFVDHGAVHHHSYLTHNPNLWLGLLLVGLVLRFRVLIGLGLGAVLHLAMDTIAGAVVWGWAGFGFSGPLVVVPATQDHWILSFLVHWTFGVELVLTAVALIVLWRRRVKVAT
jgi:inner membrane protein